MNVRSQKPETENSPILRSRMAQITASVLLLAQGLLLVPTVSAETLARAQGRCKLTAQSGAQAFTVFDGHCIVKQRQRDTTTIFVVDLDNGSEFRFFGPNKQALQVETAEGLHNAQFTENPDKGVFVWQEQGSRNRLSVKLDTQQNPNVSHDDAQPPSSGNAVASLLTTLLTGKAPASSSTQEASSNTSRNSSSMFGNSAPITPARQTNIALAGNPVDDLSDLVGARAGQAENTIRQRGYQLVQAGEPSFDGRRFSFWRQPGSGLCVTVITADGRYNAIVYSNVSNQTTCK